MRIDNGSKGSPVSGRKLGPASVTSQGQASTPRALGVTPERMALVELVKRMREMPEVRAELLEDVRRRIKRGEFLTREAAEATAEVMLADLVTFLGM